MTSQVSHSRGSRVTDANLKELQLAADRLLAGNNFRSNGDLTITSLMKEAELPRPYSARQPYAEVVSWFKQQAATARPAVRAPSDVEQQHELLKAQLQDLKADLSSSQSLNKAMASKILLLTANVDGLTSMLEAARNVRSIGPGQKRPGKSDSM